MRRALLPVAAAFKRWEQGELGSGEVCDLIHRLHQGPARDLYLRYNTNNLAAPVAHAIVMGILDRGAVPPEVLDHVARMIHFYESELAES